MLLKKSKNFRCTKDVNNPPKKTNLCLECKKPCHFEVDYLMLKTMKKKWTMMKKWSDNYSNIDKDKEE